MRFQVQVCVLACVVLVACQTGRTKGAATVATPPVPTFCALKVNGATLQDVNGNSVVLHGATLPTLRAMEASGESPAARVRTLADAGAKLVRLPVTDEEFNAPFMPEKVLPFADVANQLGMVVILSWQQPTENRTAKKQAEEIEDWLRNAIIYLADRPGIWLDPFNQPLDMPVGRQRAVAQRMADVLTGYRYKNLVLINNPTWFLDGDPEHSKPLSGNNAIYGVADLSSLARYPTERVPFISTALDDPSRAPVNIGTIVVDASNISQPLKTFWQAQSKNDLRNCVKN